MRLEELRCALAVEPEESYLDEEALLLDRGYLLSVCGGLKVMSEDKETVRFIHYTIQEYFQRTAHPEYLSSGILSIYRYHVLVVLNFRERTLSRPIKKVSF